MSVDCGGAIWASLGLYLITGSPFLQANDGQTDGQTDAMKCFAKLHGR